MHVNIQRKRRRTQIARTRKTRDTNGRNVWRRQQTRRALYQCRSSTDGGNGLRLLAPPSPPSARASANAIQTRARASASARISDAASSRCVHAFRTFGGLAVRAQCGTVWGCVCVCHVVVLMRQILSTTPHNTDTVLCDDATMRRCEEESNEASRTL